MPSRSYYVLVINTSAPTKATALFPLYGLSCIHRTMRTSRKGMLQDTSHRDGSNCLCRCWELQLEQGGLKLYTSSEAGYSNSREEEKRSVLTASKPDAVWFTYGVRWADWAFSRRVYPESCVTEAGLVCKLGIRFSYLKPRELILIHFTGDHGRVIVVISSSSGMSRASNKQTRADILWLEFGPGRMRPARPTGDSRSQDTGSKTERESTFQSFSKSINQLATELLLSCPTQTLPCNRRLHRRLVL